MTISAIKDIVTILGVLFAAVSLAFTAVNTKLTVKWNRARYWLEFQDRFSPHDEVHRRLRPGGLWASGKGPESPEDWAMVEAYMGFLEQFEPMIEEGLILERTFRERYAYRLNNIIANDIIWREKLQDSAVGWRLFLALNKRMGIWLPQ